MIDPTTALTAAIENSTKVANTPIFSTVIDRLLGFKVSEWKAQGDVIKKHIADGYEEAKQKGLGFQYVSAFRENTNLINISAKAAGYLNSEKQNDVAFDNDVFWGLIEHAKDISNEEVQELIAKIIAGEYNIPGTYSMSTLQTIKMLGKNELELFEKICTLIVNGDQIPHNIFMLPENIKEIMAELSIDFGSLQLLQSLGLVLPNDMRRTMRNPEKLTYQVSYFDKKILFSPENEDFINIQTPNFYGLSPVGIQIVKHLSPKFSEKYFDWLKENYKISNYKLLE
jgi:hypothetical protein